MPVTNENSTQMGKVVANPVQLLDPRDLHGRLRYARFNFTQGAAAGDANSTQRLVKLPAGKVRVLLAMSRVANSAFGASRVLNLGWEAHNLPDGTAVAASANGLDASQDVSGAGAYAPTGTVGGDETYEFTSGDGVVLVSQVTGGTIPAAATLNGYICYVMD